MARILTFITSTVVRAIFPRLCVRCGDEGGLLCRWCSGSVDFGPLPFAYANPVVRELLRSWKYYGDISAWDILRAKARSRVDARGYEIDGIVPIPLVGYRERYRGFNQAKQIGEWLSVETKVPVFDCLGRRFVFGVQAKRSREWRKRAMEISPFFIKEGSTLPRRLLLVDDVITSGATMEAAKRVLLAAGVESVATFSLIKGG